MNAQLLQKTQQFLSTIDKKLDGKRFAIDGKSFVLPSSTTFDDIKTAYLMVLEEYAKKIASCGNMYEFSISEFLQLPITNIKEEDVLKFWIDFQFRGEDSDRNVFIFSNYGYFEGTCWSYKDLLGVAISQGDDEIKNKLKKMTGLFLTQRTQQRK